MAARVYALAKSQRSRQMDFTSLLPVTSGHCTEWQKPGHNASPGHWYALTQWLLCRSCRGKILSCSTTLATGCTYKSRGIVVGRVQAVAAIANDESLQVRVRKAHPPEGRSSLHPSAHKGARTGCALTLRNAASLQKHCPVACKARVKQVRPWTYPSMVYVPICTKLVMSDINRGN